MALSPLTCRMFVFVSMHNMMPMAHSTQYIVCSAQYAECKAELRCRGRGSHLVDESAHAGAGRQHDQHVGEEHEVALLLVLRAQSTQRTVKSRQAGVKQVSHRRRKGP